MNSVKTRYKRMIKPLSLDSGAYSKRMGSRSHRLSDYLNYINRYGHLYDAIFNLDDSVEAPAHNTEKSQHETMIEGGNNDETH